MMFEKPTEIDDATVVFPAGIKDLMPPYDQIPAEFKSHSNPYVRFQSEWFFRGLSGDQIPKAKPGIDAKCAFRHLSAIQGSFEPKHEHKMAAVAYLASLWLEEPTL